MAPIPSKAEVERERDRIRRSKAFRKALSGTIYSLLVIAALAILVSSLVLPILQISGDSMDPTLKDGEIIVLLRTKRISKGSLCSFTWNNRTLIKRVIAGPGDWVDIADDGTVRVNGEVIDEPYVTERGLGECDLEFPYQVPEDSYFTMGDNRNMSVDSRSSKIGCVHSDQIIGQVWLRVWPIPRFGPVDRDWRA